jgi:predicted DNA-binding transcriptional regulator AlpA
MENVIETSQGAIAATAPPPREVIRFLDGCAYLGVSRDAAEYLLRQPDSDFPRPFFIGRKRFYRRSDLAAWVEAKATAALRSPHVPERRLRRPVEPLQSEDTASP